ncbi:MAG: hypothetical protein OET44_17540 [Gammaproteobacteria bacterium]|nr:hypothetical protein [Gammaproteobacteria bacterium]
MCRLLYVRCVDPFAVADVLTPFADVARNSTEYQGHGWGCASWAAGRWHVYHDIKPVWEDDLTQFAQTTVFIAHARSAFRDEGIAVENNMPFSDGESMFVFNGELNGVRIRESGRIGAEKIYNYIRRFDKGDKLAALERATRIINKRTRYVRAMNIVLAQGGNAWLATQYNEDPVYFQMHNVTRGAMRLVCSEPFRGESDWTPIANGTVSAI